MAEKVVLRSAEEKMKKAVESVIREFHGVRTGRASAELVDHVVVEHYGAQMKMNQLATITVPEPKMIMIQPWDQSATNSIMTAIQKSDLGIMPQSDGKVVRLGIPQLTHERRVELDKVIKRMAEDGRVSVRAIRRDANDEFKKLHKAGTITEDEERKAHEDVQKVTDKHIEKIDALLKEKEQEILGA
ncbi:MAG: ribosome recycling factor [Candidatus Omnitrophica bacterium]|nr:ribosome recycling factor [Candidatus Omnitrophota bacterium]